MAVGIVYTHPMPDYREIYDHHAQRYDELVAHEDVDGALGRTLAELLGDEPPDVVEAGAGTGRVTALLLPRARSVRAFDAAAAMIAVAREKLPTAAWGVARHEALPVADASVDLAIEGWAFGHALGWNPAGWRDDLRAWVRELERVLRPGGRMVLIETMGTGVEQPFAGGHSLEPFHAFVTRELGFDHRAIRTDYQFDSVDHAERTLGFFFGEKMATRVRDNGWSRVPECTGVYWRDKRA